MRDVSLTQTLRPKISQQLNKYLKMSIILYFRALGLPKPLALLAGSLAGSLVSEGIYFERRLTLQLSCLHSIESIEYNASISMLKT